MLDPRQTVASVVLDHSATAVIFQRHRIDYCCRGNQSIDAACAERRLDTAALIDELERAIGSRSAPAEGDPRALSDEALVSLIVSRHHEYLRKALPFVGALAAKVARVHGDHEPKLRALDAVVRDLTAALEPHLDDEEQTLFPLLLSKPQDRAEGRALAARELEAMQVEHLAVGRLLEAMRAAASDYTFPDWACNSYRTLFAELSELEGDVLRHVHLENHVLMPRFVAGASAAV